MPGPFRAKFTVEGTQLPASRVGVALIGRKRRKKRRIFLFVIVIVLV